MEGRVSEQGRMGKKPRYVQTQNPRTKRWIKIDTRLGRIVSHKRSEGAYRGVPIVEKERVANGDTRQNSG